MNYRLPKNERLHADKLIKELFNEGSSFFLFPFKVQYFVKKTEDSGTQQVLFSVSKKKIKKAVGRNLVKRRIREAYRLNKHLLPLTSSQVMLGLVYVHSVPLEFAEIERKLIQVLRKLNTLLEENQIQHE